MPACHAPFTSMRLEPDGSVLACCQNNWHRLGSVRESSLAAIWHGEAARQLREAVAEDRFDLGCELCGELVAKGQGASAYLASFAHLPVAEELPAWPLQLELALSNACNLQCTMCNGDLSSAIRIHREHRPPLPKVYGDRFFDELAEVLAHLRTITFLGGEPFLSSEVLRTMDLLEVHAPSTWCHVTTNGTQLGPRVERFVTHQPCHVAISIDGASAEVNERIRVGTDHQQVLANIERFRQLAASVPTAQVSLAFSLMPDNVHELVPLLAWATERDLDVFVNQVSGPPSASLLHLPTPELARLVADLEAAGDAEQDRLGRNLPVWRRQVEALRARIEAPAPGEVAVAVGRSPRPERRPDATIVLAPDQAIAEVDLGPEWRWGDLGGLVGERSTEIMHVLQGALGALVHSELSFEAGREVRTMAFDRSGGVDSLRAELVDGGAGTFRWEVWITPTPGDQAAPAT